MNMESDDIVVERPAVATAVVALVAGLAYLAIQLVLDDAINWLETGLFVVAFTVVYVAGNYVLRRREMG